MHYPFSIINCAFALAVASAAAPNFDDHILPIFEQSCTNCHNPDKQKGDLDLTTYSAAMRGGSGGKIAEPGEGGDSTLYGVITHTLKPKMPPKGEKLEKKDADLIRAWVDGGLLENKSGKPKKKTKPAFALQAAPSAAKPDKIAMPQHLLLEPVVTSSRSSAVADMVSSPWAPLLAVTGQRQVLLYNTDTLELSGVLPFEAGQPETLSFHPSGKYLLAGGGIGGKSGTTITWDIETGKEILRAGKDFDSVIAASLRADLGGVGFGGPGKRVKLWDTTDDEQLISIKKHTDWVTQLGYSHDGVLLASGGRGGGVYVWEADTGNPFYDLRGHKGAITGLAWRADSNLLATASEDGSVLLWSMKNGKQVKKISAHVGGVLSLDWTKNGHLVTSGRDKIVKIWKPDFNLLKSLPKFSNMVTEVAFSHDGKRIFAGDWAGNITVWVTTTQKQIGVVSANPPSIAKRILNLQNEAKELPTQILAAKEDANAKTATSNFAKAHLSKIETGYRDTITKHTRLKKEYSHMDTQLKKLQAEARVLNQLKQQRQEQLALARAALNKHNEAIASTRAEHRNAESEIKKHVAHEQSLVKIEEAARKNAENNPDDPALQQIAEKAKTDLENHRRDLAEIRELADQKSTALVQLSKAQQDPGNRLAAAEKACKEILMQQKTHHGKRKPIQEKRNALTEPMTKAQKLAENLKKQIKPAQANVTSTSEEERLAQARLENLRSQVGYKEKSIKRLQAAAINTEVIKLKQQAAKLTADQYRDMESFTVLAKELQSLKDPTKLKDKSRALQKLRERIDVQAPALLGVLRKARVLQNDYFKSLKSI
ncbi:MAG: c-type cytochrome domain-containing protein [Akkermansiaceae bacterium]